MESINSITKSIVGAIIFVLIVIWIANRLSVTHINTAVQVTIYLLLKILILKTLDIELLM